jgi:hypothetical protein
VSADDRVPRVMIKSHLDDDPKPRPGEIAEADAVRRRFGLDEFLIGIALPNPESTGPMQGMDLHWWEIVVVDGEAKCRPAEVEIEITPNEPPG